VTLLNGKEALAIETDDADFNFVGIQVASPKPREAG
jgi:hypothetical protein